MADAPAAATVVDGLKLAFLFVLIGIATRSMMATTAFVLSRRAAHKDSILVLTVVTMIAASSQVFERLLASHIESSSAWQLAVWIAMPFVVTASLAVWTLSETGRIWQALLVGADSLWAIGFDAESAAMRAVLLAVPLVVAAGCVLVGQPTPGLAVWGGLSASLLLVIDRDVMKMAILLFLQGALFGIGAVFFGEPGAVAACVSGVLAIAVWQHKAHEPSQDTVPR